MSEKEAVTECCTPIPMIDGVPVFIIGGLKEAQIAAYFKIQAMIKASRDSDAAYFARQKAEAAEALEQRSTSMRVTMTNRHLQVLARKKGSLVLAAEAPDTTNTVRKIEAERGQIYTLLVKEMPLVRPLTVSATMHLPNQEEPEHEEFILTEPLEKEDEDTVSLG